MVVLSSILRSVTLCSMSAAACHLATKDTSLVTSGVTLGFPSLRQQGADRTHKGRVRRSKIRREVGRVEIKDEVG